MKVAFRCAMKVSLPIANIDGCCPECNACTYVWNSTLACWTVITTLVTIAFRYAMKVSLPSENIDG